MSWSVWVSNSVIWLGPLTWGHATSSVVLIFYLSSRSSRTWSVVRTQVSSSCISCRWRTCQIISIEWWRFCFPELWFWRALAVRWFLHQVEQQCRKCRAICELPGGAGGDLPPSRRNRQRVVAVPEHAQCELHRGQLQHQALLLPHLYLALLSHWEARTKHNSFLNPLSYCQPRCCLKISFAEIRIHIVALYEQTFQSKPLFNRICYLFIKMCFLLLIIFLWKEYLLNH